MDSKTIFGSSKNGIVVIMSAFDNILVPVDGSEYSLKALEKAIQIAKKFDGKITLINVYSVSSFKITPKQVYNTVVKFQKAGELILSEAKKKTMDEKVPVETLLKEGHIVEEILKTAREGKFDLIVMGARGLSTVREILLGSVSHGIILHASCPVLLVK